MPAPQDVAAATRTIVYVTAAQDARVLPYALQADGQLQALPPAPCGERVGPLAASPDRRFLYAASRGAQPYAHTYAIHPADGTLEPLGQAPIPASSPYIAVDASGRFLLAAAYGAHVVSVSAIGPDGTVRAPALQVVDVGRHAHAVVLDHDNRFAFVPTLGTDTVFQFRFDAATGTLASNTPPVARLAPGTGPRHLVVSPDNRFVHVLGELTCTVTTFALDATSGLLHELGSTAALPPQSILRPGWARTPGSVSDPADRSHDIWAADLRQRPDGRFLYCSERTDSTLSVLAVDPDTGSTRLVQSVATEAQPRGFAVDPQGRFLVAAGERSPMLSVYHIHPAEGTLTLLGRQPTGAGANWVEMVTLP